MSSAMAIVLSGLAGAHADDAASIDLLAFSNGALIERASTAYGDAWSAIWLLDEDKATGWASEKGAKGPFEIVVSLPERSRFSRFVFDTASADQPGRSARDIDIFISDQSGTAGFSKVMTASLQEAKDDQGFDVPKPAEGRWLKFVLRTNHGDDDYMEVMNLHGFGVPVSSTPIPTVTGTYESEVYGKFHLSQAGAQLTGCYEYHDGLVQGGLEAHLMRLVWTEENGAKSGPAVMVANRDGKGFQGLWRSNEAGDSWHDTWKLRKISNDVGSCPHWRPAAAKTNMIGDTLAKQGRVRLYGINFDTDSDRLRPDATPTLDLLAAALKADGGSRITVEGHTDSTSTAAHNKDLSERRAASVKSYLTSAGIQDGRMHATGWGQEKPFTTNDTAIGRSQNRRVEIVKE